VITTTDTTDNLETWAAKAKPGDAVIYAASRVPSQIRPPEQARIARHLQGRRGHLHG